MTRAGASHVFGQLIGHGNLALGLFTEADAQGIANAVAQEGTDAHRTLDAAVLALARFGHTEMEGIVHALGLHHVAEEAHTLHHHHGIAGLDADHDILEVFAFANAQKLHTALHDARGRIAIARHDTVGKAAVVHADTDGRSVLAADVKKLAETRLEAVEFGIVFFVGIFQVLEGACGVHIVARIDTHFLHDGGGHVGHTRVEVDVGHKGRGESFIAQGLADSGEVVGLNAALGGEAHEVAACTDDALTLGHTALGVGSGTGGHALQAQGIVATNIAALDMGHVGAARGIVEEVHALVFFGGGLGWG